MSRKSSWQQYRSYSAQDKWRSDSEWWHDKTDWWGRSWTGAYSIAAEWRADVKPQTKCDDAIPWVHCVGMAGKEAAGSADEGASVEGRNVDSGALAKSTSVTGLAPCGDVVDGAAPSQATASAAPASTKGSWNKGVRVQDRGASDEAPSLEELYDSALARFYISSKEPDSDEEVIMDTPIDTNMFVVDQQTGGVYCKLCNMALNSWAQWLDHKEGKKHAKKRSILRPGTRKSYGSCVVAG